MPRQQLIRPLALLMLAIALIGGAGGDAGAQVAAPGAPSAGTFDTLPFLPWPPAPPGPRPFPPAPPPGTPPFLPPLGPADSDWLPAAGDLPPALVDLGRFIAILEEVRDRLTQWAEAARRAAADALARMIWESPGQLPQGMEPPDLVGQITRLPRELRTALETLLAKLRAPAAPGSAEAGHQAYVGRSPALSHEVAGIVATDEIVTGGAVGQAAAARAASLAAAAAARDPRLPASVAAGYQAGDTLLAGAQELPSTRAGVELLVAGMGMGMRQQADLAEAVAGRLTLLAQQTADVSSQIGALAASVGALTAREADRDGRALDAQLGLADAVGAGAEALRQMLAGVGQPSGTEMRLDSLY